MSKVFDDNKPGKGLPRSLENLKIALRGGIVADDVVIETGGSPVLVDVSAYESTVRTGGTAGNEVLQIPVGTKVGQRHLVTFSAEGNASDVVRINDDGSSSLRSGGVVGDTPSAITNVDLDTPGEFALFEYEGGDTWNLLYTDGAIS